MHPHNFHLEALEQVLAADLPEESYPQALNDQVALLEGVQADDLGAVCLD